MASRPVRRRAGLLGGDIENGNPHSRDMTRWVTVQPSGTISYLGGPCIFVIAEWFATALAISFPSFSS